jgi:hypothetical protein
MSTNKYCYSRGRGVVVEIASRNSRAKKEG